MFSHVVIFWTDPEQPNAAQELLDGIAQYLSPIPGSLHFHAGKMATSKRAVVDQSYQVALNIVFPNKKSKTTTKFILCIWSLSKKSSNESAKK